MNGRVIQPIQQAWLSPKAKEVLLQIAAIAMIVFLMLGLAIPLVSASSVNDRQECSMSNCPLSEDCSAADSASSSCCSSTTAPPGCVTTACPLSQHSLPSDHPPASCHLYLDPYVGALTRSGVAQVEHPIREFPAYLSKVVFPGWMSGMNNDLCKIPNGTLPSFDECEQFGYEMHESVEMTLPEIYAQVMNDPEYTSQKGFAFGEQDGDAGSFNIVSIGVDQRIIDNYKKAIGYVQDNVLSDPSSFAEKNAEEIVQDIKTSHRFLGNRVIRNSGNYRRELMIVFGGRIKDGGEKETPLETLIRRGGTSRDIENWKSIEKIAKQKGRLEEAIAHLTEEQLTTVKKIVFIPPPPEKIQEEMFELGHRIRNLTHEVIHKEANTVAAAAFVHQEIGRIHPFRDGNGRIARIWLNVILQLGGIKAVVIPNEEEYVAAIVEDQKSPGTFSNYLEEIIQWNREQKVLA